MPTRVLHLVGSAVDAFHADLSVLYAADCLTAVADPARYEAHVAYVTPDGRWRFPADLTPDAINAAPPLPVGAAITRIAELGVEVMVPQMFCIPGMTHYRGLFDVLGIPYLGNTPAVMALGLDKARTKAVAAAAGIAVPRGEVVGPGQRPTVPVPAVVKPVDSDNSLGLSLVTDAADFPAAIAAACEHSPAALVETYVELGREVRCGVVEVAGGLRFLPLEEYAVDAVTKPVRDRADKLDRGAAGELLLVAKDATRAWIVDEGDPLTQRVWDLAGAAHRALGCRDYSLFDVRVDPAGRPLLLEASLYWSYARTSVLSMMSAAAGLELADLFAASVAAALGRRAAVPRSC